MDTKNRKANLTKAVIEAATPPQIAYYLIRDSKQNGLALRVMASGARSFVYDGRLKGAGMYRTTFGRWPDLNVTQAREMAQELRTRAAKGESLEPPAPAEEGPTFGFVCDEFLRRHARVNKKTWAQDEATYGGPFRVGGEHRSRRRSPAAR